MSDIRRSYFENKCKNKKRRKSLVKSSMSPSPPDLCEVKHGGEFVRLQSYKK